MEELIVIKIGGNVIDNEQALDAFLTELSTIGGHKILIHGGGKLATELSTKLGIETKMVDGRRITDEETIKVVTMTYAGFVNKTIVAKLQARGNPAIGLSGVDARIIPAVKRPVKDVNYGWVGDILTEKINAPFLSTMLAGGYTPVIAPIACDDEGHLLNINADTVAQSVAVALSGMYATTLIYCFEKNGVLRDVNDDDSAIPVITLSDADTLKADGTISKGMIPKIDNACQAIRDGVKTVVIGHAAHISHIANKEKGYGTTICE
jgi:acetylglutamate kinase